MLHFYSYHIHVYAGGKKLLQRYMGRALTDTPKNFTEQLTWDNAWEKLENKPWDYPLKIQRKRKGLVVWLDSYSGDPHFTVKQWKKALDITLVHEFRLYNNPPIEEVLRFYDGEKAIQYLVERGLSVAGR